MRYFLMMLFALLSTGTLCAQKRSDKIKPQWLKHTPVSKTYGLCYVPVTVYSNDIQSVPTLSLNELTRCLPRNWNISTNTEVTRESYMERENNTIGANKRTQSYKLNVVSEGEPVTIHSKEVDSYWEDVRVGGNRQIKCTTLYQVTAPNSNVSFDETYTTTKYGCRGLWRSMLIPGWGQFYKGSTGKGCVFLGGTAALVGGTVYLQSRINNTRNLMTQTSDVDHLRTYSNRLSNFNTARNICIGAVAALYIWNVVDAIVAPGARRVVVRPAAFGSATPYNSLSSVSLGASVDFNF